MKSGKLEEASFAHLDGRSGSQSGVLSTALK